MLYKREFLKSESIRFKSIVGLRVDLSQITNMKKNRRRKNNQNIRKEQITGIYLKTSYLIDSKSPLALIN